MPTDDTFAGSMDIGLELRAATSLLWLNAAEITVREARLDAGGQSLTAKPVASDTEFLGFAFDRSLRPARSNAAPPLSPTAARPQSLQDPASTYRTL